jgi:hypothetical protein
MIQTSNLRPNTSNICKSLTECTLDPPPANPTSLYTNPRRRDCFNELIATETIRTACPQLHSTNLHGPDAGRCTWMYDLEVRLVSADRNRRSFRDHFGSKLTGSTDLPPAFAGQTFDCNPSDEPARLYLAC